MPLDKQQNGKPVTPILSANFRSTKSPLTPRLAGSGPNTPASAHARQALGRTKSPAREIAAPAQSINGNITPRSATRRSRIGTESPSTTATNTDTNLSRLRKRSITSSIVSPSSAAGLGISSPGLTASNATLNQSQVTPPAAQNAVAPRRVSGSRSTVQNGGGDDRKFFQADAAKSCVALPATTQNSRGPEDNVGFFFVGGPQGESPVPNDATTKRTDEAAGLKFFHADDVRKETRAKPSPRLVPQAKSSVGPIAQTSRPAFGRAATTQPSSRSTSPNKPLQRNLRSSTPCTPPRSPQKPVFGRKSPAPELPVLTSAKRTSVGSNVSTNSPNLAHKKSPSTSSLHSTPRRKISLSTAIVGPLQMTADPSAAMFTASPIRERPRSLLLSPEAGSPSSASLTSSNTIATSNTSNFDRPDVNKLPSSGSLHDALASISSPRLDPAAHFVEKSKPAPDNAANARRERKVLDLEISNSSLLAINKTLERELQKQSTELRRFRRLSRSGRLSLAPAERAVSGSTLASLAELDSDHESASEPDNDSDLDIDGSDILSNDSSSLLSPTSKAKQRARDEKRLMLDLSRHQQMLLDSQKLTQSIRRCLTCTDELIRDGNRAIEYHVGIGEIKLGGRVLSSDGVTHRALDGAVDEPPQRQGLLSPSIKSSAMTEADLWRGNSTSNGVTRSPSPEREAILAPNVERLFQELLQV